MIELIELALLIGIALVPGIILHEYAHGWTAYRLGDPTAKLLGRLTLNPIRHIDPVGSVFVPGILIFSSWMGWTPHLLLFGWAKPVPVNFQKLRNPKRDMMIVAAAGPIVNVLIAVGLAQMIRVFGSTDFPFLDWAIVLNLTLAVFNMIPIPPLDGSRILSGVLPDRMALVYNQLEPYGIIIVLVLLQIGFLSFIYPWVDFLTALLGVKL